MIIYGNRRGCYEIIYGNRRGCYEHKGIMVIKGKGYENFENQIRDGSKIEFHKLNFNI